MHRVFLIKSAAVPEIQERTRLVLCVRQNLGFQAIFGSMSGNKFFSLITF